MSSAVWACRLAGSVGGGGGVGGGGPTGAGWGAGQLCHACRARRGVPEGGGGGSKDNGPELGPRCGFAGGVRAVGGVLCGGVGVCPAT